MQRYKMSDLAQKHTHYLGGVGRYDIFYDSRYGPRAFIKWSEEWGRVCMVTRDASEPTGFDFYSFEELNGRLQRRHGPPMSEDEYVAMVAICGLFGPIVVASVRPETNTTPVQSTANQKD